MTDTGAVLLDLTFKAGRHLYRKQKAKKDAPTPGFVDPFRGDAAIKEAYDRVVSGDTSQLDAFLDTRDDGWLVAGAFFGDHSDVKTSVIEQWAWAAPSGRSLGWLGNAQVHDAWEVRGNGVAKTVNNEARKGFRELLDLAEATLIRGTEVDPQSAEPWVGLITTARGRNMRNEELRRRFEEVHKREPFRPDACGVMLQGICEKWGGSHAEMFEFARWIEANAPADSPARVALPVAHLEFVLSEKEQFPKRSEYYKSAAVSAEICNSLSRYLASTPTPGRATDVSLLNSYLFAIQPIDETSAQLAEEVIERLDGRVANAPWHYFTKDVTKRFDETVAHRRKRSKELLNDR